jgi:pilus assembly protein CpaB
MNRTRLLFIGILALGLGGLLSSFVYKTLQNRTTRPQPPGTDVVVAASDLHLGAKIEDRDLKLVKFPEDSIPEGVFHSKTRVVGRGVVLPIAKGEFILPSKVAGENAGSGMPGLIPPGMRAVSVRVNEVVAVAGFVVPGTRVDVLLTGSPGGTADNQTTTVLENIAVLAAGQKLERNAAGEPQSVPVITLLVSPEDAQKLTLASQEGRIQLSLRNPLDTNQQKLPSVRNAVLYGTSGPTPAPVSTRPKSTHVSKPAALPPTTYTIEVIRGQEKKEIKFDH